MLPVLRGIARIAFVVIVLAAVGIGGATGLALWRFGRDLPDTQQLADYVPATGSKVYAGDGTFMAEFETEHRIPVAIGKVPQLVVQAFLAAEDRDFYSHRGVNPSAIFRAAMTDILRYGRGQRPIGASTITQQVVRHFLLTNEVSVARKVKEALLAYRIEKTLSKDRILEIYLNEIYLGAGSYGVAAAADTYFQKPLDRLTLSETAFLAALPKGPNNYNPARHLAAARARRDWVLDRMQEAGFITPAQAKAAMAEPLSVNMRPEPQEQLTDLNGYFAEEVRRELVGRFGEKAVYGGGLTVRTSYVPVYQEMAEKAFRQGLVAYDRRHGWRGPLGHLPTGAAAQAALATMLDPPGTAGWQLAAVTATDVGGATIALRSGGIGRIPLAELRWARRTAADQRLGAAVGRVSDVLSPGDIVLVEPVGTAAGAAKGRHVAAPVQATYSLQQIPDVSGGFVAMDPKTGRVFAMVGGWSFRQSQFNRATQAKRQPGSSFKPLVYLTALQNGFTPDSTVDDSPVAVPQGPGLPAWQPVNYEGGYVGPTTLEDALVHSRNLATVHVAMQIGLPAIAKTAQNFDVMDKMPLYYSMALGAGETTLLRMTNAYSMIDNGGHWLLPSVIDLVQDRDGRILYQKGVNGCAACFVAAGVTGKADNGGLYRASGPADPSWIYLPNTRYGDNAVIFKPNKPDPLVSEDADREIIQMMKGVVERGTGVAVAAVGKPIAGKTGTTSDWFDAWFVGFSPDLAAGVFVGFDEPRTLGTGEVGGHVAAPIFRDFMIAALKDAPAKDFPAPAAPVAVVASASSTAAEQPKTLASLGRVNPYVGSLPANDPGKPDNADRGSTWTQPPDMNTAVSPPTWPDYPPTANGGYGAAQTEDDAPWGPAPEERNTPTRPRAAARGQAYAVPRVPDYAQPWAPSYGQPSYGYAQPGYSYDEPDYSYSQPGNSDRRRQYPSAQPGYAYTQPGYAQPGYGAGYPQSGYGAAPSYPQPAYPAPPAWSGWSGRPTAGTGGLY